MNDVIDFLRTLEQPNRLADCMIAELVVPWRTPENRVTYYGEPTGEHMDPEACGFFRSCKAYTASIDDALTLKPSDTQWALDSHHKMAFIHAYHNPCYAEDSGHTCYTGEGATLAIALCIASLLAQRELVL